MRYFICIAFIAFCSNINGQEVDVKSFEYLQTDLTARTQEKLDANGNPCAVVKVDIPLEDVVFKGWVVETVSTPGEYLVYMPEGTTKITMQHKTLTPFTYEFDKPLTGKNTYRLVVMIIRADPSKPVYKVIEVSDEIKESYKKGLSLFDQNKEDEAIKLIQEAANAGYAPAQYKYAQSLSGKESITWYQKAASQGFADAICELGDVYMQGKDVSRDAERAFKYYIEAIDLNSSKAMLHVGECCEKGEGTPQDMGKAFWYYKKAADLGELSAYSKVAYCYWEGIGIKMSREEAIKWYMEGSEKGDTISCFKLGEFYSNGNPYTGHDKNKALEMYRKAAEKGMARAQESMALHYDFLSGEMYYKKNQRMADEYFKEVLMWYQKAAEQGNRSGLLFFEEYNECKSLLNEAKHGDPKAQYDLGIMYLQDRKVGDIYPDIQKGIEWLKKSGRQKYLEALIKLGDIYSDIFEVFSPYCSYYERDDRLIQYPNRQEAAKYYIQAAELGNFHAQLRLGELYDSGGEGLHHDYSEAIKWYLRAATHDINNSNSESDIGRKPNKDNISYAQCNLGELYMRKEIGKEKEGLKWIRKAAENGSYRAKQWLEHHKK